jgi:hypothetical protein
VVNLANMNLVENPDPHSRATRQSVSSHGDLQSTVDIDSSTVYYSCYERHDHPQLLHRRTRCPRGITAPNRTLLHPARVGRSAHRREASRLLRHFTLGATPHHTQVATRGLSLERIREILCAPDTNGLPPPRPRGAGTVDGWSHLVVTDGLEVTLEPSRAGLSPEDVRAFFRGVTTLYEQLKQGNDDAEA